MSIILKGVDMPQKLYTDIRIYKDGRIKKIIGENTMVSYNENVQAIQIPKGHGDIVNFRELEEQYWDGNYMEIWKHDLKDIKPILEAEE